MYKVITHTIKEEHFNHPLTVNSVLPDRTQQQQPVNPFTTDSAVKYRDSVKTAVTNWVNSFRSLVVAVDKDEIGSLLPEVKRLGESFTSTAFGSYMMPMLFDAIDKPFQQYHQSLTDYIIAAKNKTNVAETKDKARQDAVELSKALSRINRFWTDKSLIDIFSPIIDEFGNQVDARAAKQFSTDLASVDMVNQLLLNGLTNGQQSLVDVLSKGMILLFTSRFR